jgi:hypothetical protein
LQFQYRTVDLPLETGLFWTAGLAHSQGLAAPGQWTAGEWRFQAAQNLSRVILAYRRSTGASRIEGRLLLTRIQLKHLLPSHEVADKTVR